MRLFTKPKTKAYDALTWTERESFIGNPATGKTVFEQNNLEFPEGWSQNAINIVAQKYFTGTPGSDDRESSLKTLINRVVDTIVHEGQEKGYFDSKEEAEDFREELKYVLATQRAAFNSPVWFNIGAKERAQQASACFILGIDDTMEDILQWVYDEGLIFKGGSGAGVNLSPIRGSTEKLGKSAGTASGPLSFMRAADSSAGAIKSGGKTRRAAKMVILNADHPDIQMFIDCKMLEERKARVLQENGFDMTLDGKDIFSVQYQNANNSMRVTDEFMQAVEHDRDWNLKAVKDGATVKTIKARDLMRQFAEAAWECADPGMQFDTTINNWHTTPNAGRINGSNPCSEYMHLDNSACNLASLNLLKFLKPDNTFDIKAFEHTVKLIFTAQEILVGYSSYPTEKIGKNARAYRELGIGYANLGALLMAQGLAYDSAEGRAQAAAITAILTGMSYAQSSYMASRVGPFDGYMQDKEGMLKILNQHQEALDDIDLTLVHPDLLRAAREVWAYANENAARYGVRNSQASVLAPTGTIGLMMDCDTTGVEPDFSLVKHKNLVGGGSMSIVNQTVPRALTFMGYSEDKIKDIVEYIAENNTVVKAPHMKPEHYEAFACAVGDNAIHYLGHVKMMAAVQPFISGAISKTVNLPEEATVEDIEQLHIDAWKMGIKAIAIYRDNCKVAQPLSGKKKEKKNEVHEEKEDVHAKENEIVIPLDKAEKFGYTPTYMNRKMPRRRNGHSYQFEVGGLKGFFTVNEYEDGKPGELFINASKQGSTLAGLMDSFAISVSHGLQHGVPLKSYVKTLMGTSFAPNGLTDDPDVKMASSVTDYIVRRLALDYLGDFDKIELGLISFDDIPVVDANTEAITDYVPKLAKGGIVESTLTLVGETSPEVIVSDESAPICFNCGNATQRAGSCYVCSSCGSTTGCS